MTQMTIPQAMNLATQQTRAGKLPEAESILRQILAAQPDHADATHMLGMIAFQSRQFDPAAQLILRSIQLNPNQAGYYCNLGQVLNAMGRIDEALQATRQALVIDANMLEANNNLGNLLQARGELGEAIACYRKVLAIKPDVSQVWMNLALALHNIGDLPGAIDAYQRLLTLNPDDVAAMNNLANALQQSGKLNEAVEFYHKALVRRSIYPEAYNNLGQALVRLGRTSEAIDALQQAVAQKPDYAEAFRALGGALRMENRTEEAIAAHRRALEIQPSFAEGLSDLGNALGQAGRFDEAIESYRRAISIMPDYAIAHFNMALDLLTKGQFAEGWIEHEWRWRVPEAGMWQAFLAKPKWTGEELNGRTILLHAEQGFGDSIQFIRYLPMVAARGGKMILYCQPELAKLFANLPGIDRIVSPPGGLPGHDVQCALMSLPGVFNTSLESIPAEIPYLRADAELSLRWHQRVNEVDARLRIGLAWAGRPEHRNDRNRSINLSALAPLADVPGAVFFSLQKLDAAHQAESPPSGMKLIDWTSELTDFADTAALIDKLDLVIAVDTAVLHLAGAMGRKVWTLLPFVPDWRWLLDREDSPWYPTMRLFRQPSPGDWTTPIEHVAQALVSFSGGTP